MGRRRSGSAQLLSAAVLVVVLHASIPLGSLVELLPRAPVCSMACAGTETCCCVPPAAEDPAPSGERPAVTKAVVTRAGCPDDCATPARTSTTPPVLARDGRAPGAPGAAVRPGILRTAGRSTGHVVFLGAVGPRGPPR